MANLPIADFLTTRLTEYDSSFELRTGTGFEKLFFQPIQFIVQPLRDEANDVQTAQSFRRILLTDDPNAFSEDSVDDLASNLFVNRRTGSSSSGVARALYDSPVAREYAANAAVFVGSNGEEYSNPSTFFISEAQMGAQIADGLYFFDIPVSSANTGDATELDIGGLIQLQDDPDVTAVTNLAKIEGGLERENNVDYIERSKNSIAVRDLVTGKGFNAILFENFSSSLKELQPVGFGDEEMMRDILFNAHVGGKVDGHFCAPTIRSGSTDFIGVLIDTTRQAFATANVLMSGTLFASVGNPSIDRTGGKNPIVSQVKTAIAAEFVSSVDITSPIDLSVNQRIKMTIDGVTKEFRVAGVSPASTNRNEIVALINAAFGVDVAFPTTSSFRIRSANPGLNSEIILADPDTGTTALLEAFGLTPPGPHEFLGDGPLVFLEGTHYEMEDANGEIRRVIGPTVVPTVLTGETSSSNAFQDLTVAIFAGVVENDILSISSGADVGDYRVLVVIDDNNLIIDKILTATAGSISYEIKRSGIKDQEVVFVEYFYNPLSLDIGNLVKLDPEGKTRGIRPGRESRTIVDTAFLQVTSIEVIDPITFEATGVTLTGGGGFGAGGFGVGSFAIGSRADFFLTVNEPHERFSAFEDSFLVLNPGFSGLSFRVNYDYVPEVVDLHNFVLSENERVLDGDTLMRHFFPAFVEGNIEYSVDETDTTIPTNEELQLLVRDFISKIKAGQQLQFSDIKQFIGRQTDPFDRFGSFIKNFTLKARMPNTDGTITVLSGVEFLDFPKLDPFPKDTDRPQSARISHWFARNGLTLTRLTGS